jgi:hypothetical protein
MRYSHPSPETLSSPRPIGGATEVAARARVPGERRGRARSASLSAALTGCRWLSSSRNEA